MQQTFLFGFTDQPVSDSEFFIEREPLMRVWLD